MGNNNCWTRVKDEFQSNDLTKKLGIKEQHDFIDSLVIQRKAKGQEHLFKSFDNMTPERREELKDQIAAYLTQLDSIDYDLVDQLYQEVYVNPPAPIKATCLDRVNSQFSRLASDEQTQQKAESEFKDGLLAIAEGKVAVVIMAGGQASRLGASCPKGAYDLKIDGYENPTLFHVFANKIEALERHARNTLPQRCKNSKDLIQLYIMTSSGTDKDTKDYFISNKYFGLSEGQVHFFQQGNLPALDRNGKIFLKEEFDVFMAPNGNGGLYDGVEEVLPKMREQGVEYIHIVGVDNILNKLADPIMIGYAIQNKLDFVSKFVKKTEPGEKVGIHVELNQQLTIIEYSELSEEQRFAKLGEELQFNQGFLAQFMISRSLMEELIKTKDPRRRKAKILAAQRKAVQLGVSVEELQKQFGSEYVTPEQESEQVTEKGWQQYHLAIKNIQPLWDTEKGIQLEKNPEPKENGMKFEQFIFDPFMHIKSYALQEVSRDDEFAPIKNKEDTKTDNRRTALELQSKLHMKWLQNAGYRFAEGLVPDGEKNIVFVDPRLSYFGEGIADGSQSPVINSLPFVLPCNLPSKN